MGTVQSRITDFISVEASPVGNTSMSTTAPATIEPKEQNIRFESNKKEQKEGGAEEEKLEEVTEEERGVQELMSTKEDMSTSENNELTTAPSVVQQNLVCKNDGRGHCGLHGSEMIKLNVSKQVWCDRGKGRGYGWRTKKVPKYICRDKKNIPEVPTISTKSSDRADCYSSPVQNSSAGLGGGISDRVNPIILETSTGQDNTKD